MPGNKGPYASAEASRAAGGEARLAASRQMRFSRSSSLTDRWGAGRKAPASAYFLRELRAPRVSGRAEAGFMYPGYLAQQKETAAVFRFVGRAIGKNEDRRQSEASPGGDDGDKGWAELCGARGAFGRIRIRRRIPGLGPSGDSHARRFRGPV